MIIDHLEEPIPGSSLRPTPSGDAYTDPEIFTREQSEIFEKMWNCVLRSDSLASPGEWKTVTVGREEIIVVRSRKKGIQAYFNVCAHRGMRVCTTGEGKNKTLQCGYHAWTYALEGELVAAPNLTSMPDVDRQEYGLKPSTSANGSATSGSAWPSPQTTPSRRTSTRPSSVRSAPASARSSPSTTTASRT